METKQISYMLAIAETGNVTKAAERLFITQSALDQQLLKLERELGARLFHRARNRLVPTEAGEIYLRYARQMLGLKEEAYRIIQDLADRRRGELSMAFAPERGMEMFMDIYPAFYAAYPGVTVTPREMGVRLQLERLQRDELDVGFVSMAAEKVPGLTIRPIVREDFLLIAPLGSPLAARAAPPGAALTMLRAGELEQVPLSLMYRESTQRDVIDPFFDDAGVAPRIFLETASNRANVIMVEKGLSCSILPRWYAEGNPRVARFQLEGGPHWTISACYREGRYLSQAAQDFIARACDYLRREPVPPKQEETYVHL